MKIAIAFLLLALSLPLNLIAQNFTPQPTYFSLQQVVIPTVPPNRSVRIPLVEVEGVRVETVSTNRVVFSNNLPTNLDHNKRLYYWTPSANRLVDTSEEAVPGSVIMPEHGEFMVYLYDEIRSGRDINTDGVFQIVLRFYHFTTGQRMNIGIPARSFVLSGERIFEYRIENDLLVFSTSSTPQNSGLQTNASWQVINLRELVHAFSGTPTSTPTPLMQFTPTPTPSHTASPTVHSDPTDTPTPLPLPTIPPGTAERADINGDGRINMLDLLLFQHFWRPQGPPTPTPTFFLIPQ